MYDDAHSLTHRVWTTGSPGARRWAGDYAKEQTGQGSPEALRLTGTAGIKHVTPIREDECYSGGV